MKRLADKESRVMKPSRWLSNDAKELITIEAHCEDSETPLIKLNDMWLTDSLAEDVIDRLQRALSILPTSK